jgi:hypothetical protein
MTSFDRTRDDVANLIWLEHVNLTIPDQRLATLFYVAGLGLTRDPYLMTGTGNMWINVGRSQIHLPTAPRAQRLRGHVGLVLGERSNLLRRLESVRAALQGTCFAWNEHAEHVEVVCPWGNRIRCLDPVLDEHNAGRAIDLGLPYVQLDVPTGTASGIARFYERIFMAQVRLEELHGAMQCKVAIGAQQTLVFAETQDAPAEYDGHHIQIYVANFSKPYGQLLERGLIYGEEPHQYRFADLVDPDSNQHCFTLEHEIRSLKHPLYGRSLVNRKPA